MRETKLEHLLMESGDVAVKQDAVRFLERFEDFVLSIEAELRTATTYEREMLMYEMRHDLARFRDLKPHMAGETAYKRVERAIASYGGWIERFARGEAQELPSGRNEVP